MKFNLILYSWNITLTDDIESLTAGGKVCSGTIHYSTQDIYIDKALSLIDKYKTIRHELTHAIIYETQINTDVTYTEEDICEFVAKYGAFINSKTEEIIEKLNIV